ncbi:protein-disulfide reductase DsbD [Chitinibacter sp. FCG-7]|uniref:Thiol:disulfide interchange protein DsbD n=1 Tax=Chitinibacter mangrovi TaxID=3153927 RepID=A0AAU7FFB9_9NEIS
MIKIWITQFIILLGLALPAWASPNFLPPEQAFKFSAKLIDANTAEVRYDIADGYYMYQEQFKFTATGATLGKPAIPAGQVKFDETFAKDVEAHRQSVVIRIPVKASAPFNLTAISQGCADAGLCYPPQEASVRLDPAKLTADSNPEQLPADDLGKIAASLNSGELLTILPLFLLIGLGLAFTPCVLPMMPILSSIIIGDTAKQSRRRGLALSAIYALGMALVYTLLGVAAGLAGEGLAANLQNPWVLSAFAILLVLLSLSMFGVYQLQMPASIQSKLSSMSGHHPNRKYLGVFTMGALSALIVGPCVAAPLAGSLLYISQTRDVVIGGSALFAMAVGMSIPLLLLGASAGTLLPRAGAWMDAVKRFFGVLMLATALWMVYSILPAVVNMLAWATLTLSYAGYLVWTGGAKSKIVALIFALIGLIQLFGVATGGRDALAPLAHLSSQGSSQKLPFTPVKSLAELDAILASSPNKIVMLDFYADWCVSCIEMEKRTFIDPRVQQQLGTMLLLKADVTANNADDKALLKRFNLFGPPGIIFFNQQGQEIPQSRVIGFQNAETFLQSLTRATRQ